MIVRNLLTLGELPVASWQKIFLEAHCKFLELIFHSQKNRIWSEVERPQDSIVENWEKLNCWKADWKGIKTHSRGNFENFQQPKEARQGFAINGMISVFLVKVHMWSYVVDFDWWRCFWGKVMVFWLRSHGLLFLAKKKYLLFVLVISTWSCNIEGFLRKNSQDPRFPQA